MRRAPRRLALGLALGALVGCRTQLDMEQFDRLSRSVGARTVLHEPDFSLYSPFELGETAPWLAIVSEELADVALLLEVDPGAQRAERGPLLVELRAVEGIRGRLTADGEALRPESPEAHPTHGIQGLSQGRRSVIYVEPPQELELADGRFVRGSWDPREFRGTVRHELAHALAEGAGLGGEPWFTEGLAELIEIVRSGPEGVAIDPRALRAGRRAAWRGPPLAALLEAREDLAAIAAGEARADVEWRPRLRAFFVFLLERELERGGTLRSMLQDVRGRDRAELARLEPEWRLWLAMPRWRGPSGGSAPGREEPEGDASRPEPSASSAPRPRRAEPADRGAGAGRGRGAPGRAPADGARATAS